MGDLLSVAGVPVTRQVIAGTGMTGGGQLSSNVTLSIAPGGVGSTELANSGVTPGVYGTATNIPVFTVDTKGRVTAATTVPATISGYVPDTRQVIAGTGLSGGGQLSSNVTLSANLSNATPLAVFQSGSAGTATDIARSDHKHPAVNLSMDDEVDGILGLSSGGTARSISATPGAVIWSGADGLYVTAVGAPGQVLVSGGTGAPTWGSALIVSDQLANVVYAGPTSGPAGPTSFRALVIDDLPASGVSAATYGAAATVPVFTVNAKGQITSVTNTAIAINASQITAGTLGVARGGTGAATLTGYLKGNGTSAFTGSATIPNTDITGLGTMSTQNASSVAITGGTINGTTLGATTPAAGTFTSVGMTSGTITTAPSSGNDIVNKTYADAIATGINFHQSCRLATTTALPSNTYNNGASGVGATLTATANGALSVDSTLVAATNRILVKNQGNAAHNGVYVVTQAGSAGSPYILTRATDFDTAGTGVDQIDAGDFFLITAGSSNANTSWVQQTPLPITVGTTGIVFSQFGAPLVYSAGTGLTESPAYTFNIANTGVVSGSYGGAATAMTLSINAQGQITAAADVNIAISGSQITSGTVGSAYISGSYTGITGVGTLTTPTVVSTNSATDALRITQTGTGNALVVEDSTNPDATPFVVEANGRLIVGSTATQPSLGASNTPQIGVFGNSASNNGFANYAYTASTSGSFFNFVKSRSTTPGTFSTVLSGDDYGYIKFNGDDGTQFLEGARISAEVDGTAGVNSMPGRLFFMTTPSGASTPIVRMTIGNTGNIGIGTNGTEPFTIRNLRNFSGATTAYGISQGGEIQSAVTSAVYVNHTAPTTQATTFTLGNLYHYAAVSLTVGLGSTVTNQYGFFAQSGLTTATNNYGFYGGIASGTGRWNFYAAGTADNFFGGPTTISTSSTSDALRITQTGTGNALVVEDAANPDSTPFVINSTGNVIAGYTSSILSASIEANSSNPFAGIRWNSANTLGAYIAIARSRSGTVGTNLIVSSGDTLGQLDFRGDDGSSFVTAASVIGQVDGTPGLNDMPGRLVFSTTADGASTATERMRIDSSGNVGIGTSSPGSRLQVAGTVTATAYSGIDGGTF